MEAGLYNYSAKAIIEGTVYTSIGGFSIKRQQVESLNLTADFGILRKLAEKSSGYFVDRDQINTILDLPPVKNTKAVIYSAESISALINLKWIFFIFLALVTVEWVTRKYHGGY